MTGGLTLSIPVNSYDAQVRVVNGSSGANAGSGYYFGNDVDGSFAAFIIKNSGGNSQFGGPSSLNVVQNQNAPLEFYTNGTRRVSISGGGESRFSSALIVNAESGIPASGGSGSWLVGGFSSPIAGRRVFGDGSGWQYRYARRSGSVYTDTHTF